MYKILIADDEQKIREVLREYAEYEGHQVVEAVDGMQAVELAKQEDFDIIILDVMMPRLDGFSACKEIRKFKQTPVLMLSARGEEYDKINGFELGVDDYVVKPFSPRELMLRIDTIIRRASGKRSDGESNEVFEIGADGYSDAVGNPDVCPDKVQEAAEVCPTNAIELQR